MKRYLSKEDFVQFIKQLEVNKQQELCVEFPKGYTEKCMFLKINFCRDNIVLYDTLRGSFGLIQDTPVAPWEDYAEEVFEDLGNGGEWKVFINED